MSQRVFVVTGAKRFIARQTILKLLNGEFHVVGSVWPLECAPNVVIRLLARFDKAIAFHVPILDVGRSFRRARASGGWLIDNRIV